MKNKICMILMLIIALLAVFLVGKQFIKIDNAIKPEIELTVYTLSSHDTEIWQKVKEVETEDAIYSITVEEVASSEEIFSRIIDDGTAFGFGVNEEDVKQFNNNLEETVVDEKKNKLIGIEFLTFSNTNEEGFVTADFDYGKADVNVQKEERQALYQQLYEAFQQISE